jgi:hypothetical protein
MFLASKPIVTSIYGGISKLPSTSLSYTSKTNAFPYYIGAAFLLELIVINFEPYLTNFIMIIAKDIIVALKLVSLFFICLTIGSLGTHRLGMVVTEYHLIHLSRLVVTLHRMLLHVVNTDSSPCAFACSPYSRQHYCVYVFPRYNCSWTDSCRNSC